MREPSSAARRRAGIAVTTLGVIVVAIATLTPSASGSGSIRDSRFCLVCGELGGVDAILNSLLFIPLGAGLALARGRAWRVISGICAMSILIELLQVSVISGRDASVGDVMTNTLGGLFGFLAGRDLESLVWPDVRRARQLTAVWMCLWISVQGTVAFAFRLSLTNSPYFAQTSHSLEEVPAFPGRIVSATVGGIRMPLGGPQIHGWSTVRDALEKKSGAWVETVLITANPLAERSTLFRIADRKGRDIVELTAEGSSLVYQVRTGGAALRLRETRFRFNQAFVALAPYGAAGAAKTATVRGRRSQGGATISVAYAGRTREVSIPLTLGAGWTLFSPIATDIDGSATETMLNSAWLFLLLLPPGYWVAFGGGRSPNRTPGWIIGGMAVALSIGFAMGPAFGLVASWPETLSGLAGLAVGINCSRMLSPRRTPR